MSGMSGKKRIGKFRVQTSVRLSEQELNRLHATAKRFGCRPAELMRNGITDHLNMLDKIKLGSNNDESR